MHYRAGITCAGPYVAVASVPLLVEGIWMAIEGSSSLTTATAGRF